MAQRDDAVTLETQLAAVRSLAAGAVGQTKVQACAAAGTLSLLVQLRRQMLSANGDDSDSNAMALAVIRILKLPTH